jgi:hypothetical protein
MNEFGIEDASKRHCQMYQYKLGHSHLDIVVRPKDGYGEKLIIFQEVGYIEGPTSWVGGDFKRYDPKKSWRFAKSVGLKVEIGDYTLFEANSNMRILASPNYFQALLHRLDLLISSLSPFSTYKNRIVRILARQSHVRISEKGIVPDGP